MLENNPRNVKQFFKSSARILGCIQLIQCLQSFNTISMLRRRSCDGKTNCVTEVYDASKYSAITCGLSHLKFLMNEVCSLNQSRLQTFRLLVSYDSLLENKKLIFTYRI